MAYGLQTPDIVGQFAKGQAIGEAKEQQRKDEPYAAKLRELNLSRQEQALESGRKQTTLQDMQIASQERKQKSSDMQDLGKGAAWADTEEKWGQMLDQFESEGKPVDQFRNRFDMRETIIGLNNSDFAKQEKQLANIQTLIKRMPEDQQALGADIAAVNPGAIVDYSTQMLAPEDQAAMAKVNKIKAETDKLEAQTQEIKNKKGKPKKLTADQSKAKGFYNRMIASQAEISRVEAANPNFSSADTWERAAAGVPLIGNFFASAEYQQYSQAADDWIRAKLRRESGAVIGADEMSKEYEIYFPQPGDAQDVINQKSRARGVAEDAMAGATGIDVGKVEEPSVKASFSPQDSKAMEWARANRDDPRAAKILAKLESLSK